MKDKGALMVNKNSVIQEKTKEQISHIINKAINQKELSGLNLMVIHKGKEVYEYQAGYTEWESHQLMTRDSIFRLYSMSKPITATAIMILMERGELDLFDPVSDFLPGFKDQMVDIKGHLIPVKRAMTVYDLLSMTSGLVYGGEGLSGKGTELIFKGIE